MKNNQTEVKIQKNKVLEVILETLFKNYPWLWAALAVIVIISCVVVGIFLWYQHYDTVDRPGKVHSFSWQMDVEEYHWKAVSYSDWIKDVPEEVEDYDCELEERTVMEEKPDGSVEEIEVEDFYCTYEVYEWVYYETHTETGTDKNPFYPEYPANSWWVKYVEQPGVFKVFFTSENTTYGEPFSFNYDQKTWERFQEGMTVILKVNRNGKVPFKPELPR